ncbi:MAG: efflux RND transporter periplasmic adaptor subunit [candidate division Zixibacteria bacterium]|nr:efflux RND transporter periplasmic adaptor subunit [candidate division Zixibacteria bacterium]
MRLRLRSKKFWIIGLIVVAVAVAGYVSMTGGGEEATSIQAELAFRDEIAEKVTASGRVQPQTRVNITSEVSAEILKLYVSEGNRVVKEQPLVLLDTVQLRANVAQARYSLDETTARAQAANTDFKRAKREFDKQTSLYAKQLTSETAYTDAQFAFESAEANLKAWEAQVRTQQARLDQTADNLTKTTIRAPMDGIITYLDVEVGEIAQAQTAYTQGKTLMTISDLSAFEVEVDVDETEVAALKIGQATDIRVDAFRDTSFAGSVVEIGNSALVQNQGSENYSTTFKVKVRFDETDAGIRPGMSASVDVTTAAEDNAMLIPYASVVTREFDPDSARKTPPSEDSGLIQTVNAAEIDDQEVSSGNVSDSTETGAETPHKKGEKIKKTGVFVVCDGIAKFVELGTGIADDRNIVALNGINPGDTIVSGSFQTLRKLKDGDRVAIDERSLETMRESDR